VQGGGRKAEAAADRGQGHGHDGGVEHEHEGAAQSTASTSRWRGAACRVLAASFRLTAMVASPNWHMV
jgi:hypothetical protein